MSEQASWRRLGGAAPEALSDANTTLQWASRLVSASAALAAGGAQNADLEWVE